MTLRLRAVLIAGISSLVLWITAAAWMTRDIRADLDRVFDVRLEMSARLVSGLLERAVFLPQTMPLDITETTNARGAKRVDFEIRSLDGQVLAQTRQGPLSAVDDLPEGYTTLRCQGHRWRVYVLRDSTYQITTADRVGLRAELLNELLHAAGLPFLIALLGGLVALWIGISRGLSPLHALKRQLQAKHAEDLTPLVVDRPPADLQPMLNAINGLVDRMRRVHTAQQAFTDAAAHELRTPLTIIDTHLQVATLATDSAAKESLAHAAQGVRRMRRLLDQMMALAHASAPVHDKDRCTSIKHAIENTMAQFDETQRARCHVALPVNDASSIIPQSMLETMVRNLVDNALRYSPADRPVDVTLVLDEVGERCIVNVEDRGDGLPKDQTEQAGRRFWRGDHGRQRQDGTGLGLSIVRAVVERFGGELKLAARVGGGLNATLILNTSQSTGTTAADVIRTRAAPAHP